MTSQQSSVASQTEQKAAPAALSFTEEEWDAAAAVVLRAEIGRMDAVAAATATATAEDKSIIIDGLLYVKSWLVTEESEFPGAGERPQS